MRTRRILLVAAGAALTAAAAGFYHEAQSARDGARLFDQVLGLIEDRYVDSVDAGALFEKAAHGLVAELNDPYSELFSPKETKVFNTNTGGHYGGVGMMIEDQQGAIVIARVYPNTPAERAGIHEGDRILEINGESTRGWKTQQVSEKMQGDPGSTVRTKFLRPGAAAPTEFTFTRAVIRIPAVPFSLMLDGGVGYIPLQTFSDAATSEVANQLVRLQGEGAKGIVLDLRGNGGGFLEQALSTANLFLKRGQEILSVRTRGEATARAVAETDPVAGSVPVIVLTDGRSASASEIVAGALQDHDRALILGTTSFGKGLVQTMYPLDGGWALKITTGKWYTPSGRSIHKPRTQAELEALDADTTTAADDFSKRPVFKSDAGRTVYGGGAITPDIFLRPDTVTTPELQLAQKLIPRFQQFHIATYDYALTLKPGVRPDFKVLPEWRDELLRRVKEKGVDVSKADWDAGHEYVDRFLADRLARLAFGDSTAKRLELRDDNQLVAALDLLHRVRTQRELFAAAAAQTAKSKH
jgi:carboxyl-terminal processing protease